MRRIATVVVLLLAAACTPSAGDDTPTAVATAYPLAWLVQAIAPDFEVESLAAGGQDPHDLELTPQQRAAVERSDLAVYLGDIAFQPQVEAALSDSDAAVVSALDVLGEDALLPADDDHPDEPARDPHLWFDARLMADLAVAVGDAAAQAEPANASQYVAQAETVAGDLRQLADEIRSLLSDCTHDEVVVSHEAYNYLLQPHGLTQQGISGASGHSEASAQDIQRLATLIADQELPAVLSEPVEGRTDAEAVAAEAGVEIVDIYSLDIVDEEQASKGFPALLREQADAVATAAECGS